MGTQLYAIMNCCSVTVTPFAFLGVYKTILQLSMPVNCSYEPAVLNLVIYYLTVGSVWPESLERSRPVSQAAVTIAAVLIS